MESPFSWNVRYLNRGGFPCQLTVRAEESKILLEKVGGIEKWLADQGATLAGPEVAPIAVASSPAQAAASSTPSTPAQPEGWCPIHGVQMTKNTSNDGRSWYSHRAPDGSWCKGKPKGSGH